MKLHTTKALIGLALAAVAALTSGCATIVKGTSQEIPIASEPSGARVSVNGSPSGTTPTRVTLSRKQNHVITMEKEGFESESVAITKSMGGAVAGNIIAGGLVGWGVDAVSGAQYNLHPETVNVRMRPLANGPAAPAANQERAKSFVEELNGLDQLHEQKKLTPEEYQKLRAALLAKYQT
jgi:hypothetical protein